jgi:DNA polymerase-3 subunit gamma/tau
MSSPQASTPSAGPGPAAAAERSYRVLARKYRPSNFGDLIGQDAMVRTISNAFEAGRIPQAWILTGVRGVGKTTTARIVARALNYQLPDGSIAGPTVNMPILGVHCQAIMESRHLDVIEMDAASHNGVEDVRQINDAIRYAPVSARFSPAASASTCAASAPTRWFGICPALRRRRRFPRNRRRWR